MSTSPSLAGAGNGPSHLLERADHLAALDAHLASVRESGRGRMVFIGGEAGVGKSALVRRFCFGRTGPPVRILTGVCDALSTPRPLGPFLDIAPHIGGELEALAERGGRPYEIASALIRALASGQPAILSFEDVHWADEATLDALRFLARRIEAVPALMLITYRDELDRSHPLRILLGELPPGETTFRLPLAQLSPQAVAELAAPHGVDGAELFRKTAGNPFFVTEALAAGQVAIPPTVRDAVLARVARLPPAAIELLGAVAIVPLQTDLWLLEELAGDALEHLGLCLASGILAQVERGVRFRHELARLAIEEELTPIRRTLLHRRALLALQTPPTGETDLARLVHHAEAAGDAEALLRFAPAAAARAAIIGAHREAAAHYARALRVASGLAPARRGELFGGLANESFLAGQIEPAIAAGWDAVNCFRAADDRIREGDHLHRLSRILRCTGDAGKGAEVGRQSLALLEQLPPGRELALAYANAANMCMNMEDAVGTAAYGQRAYELAERVGEPEALIHVLNTLGTMELLDGAPEGLAKLQRSLELAQASGMEEHVGRVYINLGWAATRSRSYAELERYLKAGFEYCSERGLMLWLHYVLAYSARYALDQGRWAEASELAQQIVQDPRSQLPRITALIVLALIRARRGDPEYWPALDEALALAQPTGELQYIGPVAAARAEAAWLEGRPEAVAEATAAALDLALRQRASWVIGELACWSWRAGLGAPLDGAAEPYALQIAGEWQRAADIWTERGCHYEAALARAAADDEATRRGALSALQRQGARAAASVIARRLRELGARDLPRGPRPSTRSNSAHLTTRELQVLQLIAQGLRNGDIAARLYLSPKTVDHHISAIFGKLQVQSRAEAIAYALGHGMVPAAARHRTPR